MYKNVIPETRWYHLFELKVLKSQIT